MKKTLLTSVAMLFAVTATSFASLAPTPEKSGISNQTDTSVMEARRKKRVPGGSGCDDPRDLIEHPECRA